MAGAWLRRGAWPLAVVAAVVIALIVGVGHSGSSAVRAAPDTNPDTVSVTGVGDADGAPDTLNTDFRIHVTRSTVQSAIDAQATAARRVLAALAKAGVPRHDVRTTDLTIDQHYDNNGNATGYDASETIRARIMPLVHAGRTISSAATASGNDVSVSGLSFDITDDDPLVAEARTAAYDDARGRAQQYAELAGRSLGRVKTIREEIDRPDPVPYYYGDQLYAKSSAAGAASLPVRGGRQTLTVRVSVVWALA